MKPLAKRRYYLVRGSLLLSGSVPNQFTSAYAYVETRDGLWRVILESLSDGADIDSMRLFLVQNVCTIEELKHYLKNYRSTPKQINGLQRYVKEVLKLSMDDFFEGIESGDLHT